MEGGPADGKPRGPRLENGRLAGQFPWARVRLRPEKQASLSSKSDPGAFIV